MKEKFKKLNLRLTELANYLDVSRPTLYKYIEEYENRRYKNIDASILDVFRFIKKKSTISKLQVINFIIEVKKDKQGMSRELNNAIEDIVINDNRGEELFELLELFKIKESKKIIEDIINEYVRGEKS
ncbi:MAG: hypothetical protein ACOCUI_02170 [bacterium]